MAGLIPDRVVIQLMKVGAAAIKANTAILDDILSTLNAAELTIVKQYFVDHEPKVIQGYPREDGQFPLFAIVLMNDTDSVEYIGESEMAILDAFDVKTGDTRERRRADTVAVYIYADHPDMCSYYYRIAKRIVEAATPYLIANGALDLPKLSGTELAPDPQGKYDHLWVRRLQITLEYEDEWPVGDALWIALNGPVEEFVTDADKIDAQRPGALFVDADGNVIIGKIDTIEDS